MKLGIHEPIFKVSLLPLELDDLSPQEVGPCEHGIHLELVLVEVPLIPHFALAIVPRFPVLKAAVKFAESAHHSFAALVMKM
jgi:hypothetical protein